MLRYCVLTVEEENPIQLLVADDDSVSFDISENIVVKETHPHYDGSYTIDPRFSAQELETADKVMGENLVVNAIEVSRTTNTAGGKTVYIGGII